MSLLAKFELQKYVISEYSVTKNALQDIFILLFRIPLLVLCFQNCTLPQFQLINLLGITEMSANGEEKKLFIKPR